MGDPSQSDPEVFGEYLVYERLGVGGMATVHRAKKRGIEGFERVVALKRLLSHLVEDEHFVQSFVREARLASLLQHANVVQIYDLGRVGDIYYIAMEYLRGVDLRKILRQSRYATGAPPIPFTVALMSELLDGLDYAHNLADESGTPLNLVHRDVSPSNAIVARDGHLKLIDFGIAKATTPSLRTRSGHVKGKFAYMAPEALGGKDLDRRSDVFSAGVCMWELLTARPLFAGRTDYDTIQRVRKLPIPPPSSINPACPTELDDIVLTALARDREERWGSAAAMHAAVDTIASRYSVRATNREIAQWIQWAFEQPRLPGGDAPPPAAPPVPQRAANHPENPFAILNAPPAPIMAPLDDGMDEVSIEIVWGKEEPEPSMVIEVSYDDGASLASGSVDTAPEAPLGGAPSQHATLAPGAVPPIHASGPPAPVSYGSAPAIALPPAKRTVPGVPFGSPPSMPAPAGMHPSPAAIQPAPPGVQPMPTVMQSAPAAMQPAPGATMVPPHVPAVAAADQATALAMEPPRQAVEAYIAAMADSPVGASPFDPQARVNTQGVQHNKGLAAAPLPPSLGPGMSAPRPSQIVRDVRRRKGLPTGEPVPPSNDLAAKLALAGKTDADGEVFDARITTYTGGGGLRTWHYVLFALACLGVAAGGFYLASGW